MAAPDVLYAALLVAGFTLDHFVLWRGFLKRTAGDAARARRWIWSGWLILLWTLVAAGAALWSGRERSWASLGLTMPGGWRMLVMLGLALVLVAAFTRAATQMARTRRTKRVRMPEPAARLLPHTGRELGWFVALSLTAGFCEEFIFRGYVFWFLRPSLGLWGAAVVSVVAFAAAHAYQGAKGMVASGVIGSLLTVVVVAAGSLLPAMALHALVDIGQGLVAWLALREIPEHAGQIGRS